METQMTGLYYPKDFVVGFAVIDLPNGKTVNCWLVGDYWVTDDGPHYNGLLYEQRKWKVVRKIDLSQYGEAKKIQYIRREKTAKELGFYGA